MKTACPRVVAASAAAAEVSKKLRILIVAAEFSPLSAESCIAGVSSALAGALFARGHEVRAVIPFHACIDPGNVGSRVLVHHLNVPMLGGEPKTSVTEIEVPGGIPILVIESDRYFRRRLVQGHADDDERYVFFSKAVVELLSLMHWKADVVHCIEWHAALVPDYMSSILDPRRESVPVSVLTLCDLERYTPATPRGRSEMDSPQLILNLAARGVLSADAVSIFAEGRNGRVGKLELLSPFFRERGSRIFCIPGPGGEQRRDLDPRVDLPSWSETVLACEELYRRALKDRSALTRTAQFSLPSKRSTRC